MKVDAICNGGGTLGIVVFRLTGISWNKLEHFKFLNFKVFENEK